MKQSKLIHITTGNEKHSCHLPLPLRSETEATSLSSSLRLQLMDDVEEEHEQEEEEEDPLVLSGEDCLLRRVL